MARTGGFVDGFCGVGMTNRAQMIDHQVVADLAQMLDDATRSDLLASFKSDALTLIEAYRGGDAVEVSQARHALVGIAGMIGALALRQMAQEPGAEAAELHLVLDRTMAQLEEAFHSDPAQEGQHRAG